MLEIWIDWIWYCSPVLQAALLVRLMSLRLVAQYPRFFAWMGAGLVQSLGLIALKDQPKLYMVVWIGTQALVAVFEIMAAWELFALRSRHYGGVNAFGRGLLAVIVVLAVILAFFAIGAEQRAPGMASIAKTAAILKRTVDSALALFLLTAGAVFLFFHETPVSENVLRHFRILAVYFTAIGAGFLVGNLAGRGMFTWVNLWFELISVACYALWTLAFSKQGETRAALPPASPEERARLARLDSQLSDLMKSVKL